MNRKRTKIVATISDRNCGTDFIRELYEAGMDVVRINSAHFPIESAVQIISLSTPKALKYAQLSAMSPLILKRETESVLSAIREGKVPKKLFLLPIPLFRRILLSVL
jgi:hypothetical protein